MSEGIKFQRCTVMHKEHSFLYYFYDKNLPGYFITSVASADKIKGLRNFSAVFEYFCTEIVREDDIYCILFDNNKGLFDKYVDSTIKYQDKTLHKVKKFEDIRLLQRYVAQQLKDVTNG